MTVNNVTASSKRTAAWKMFNCVFVFNLVSVTGVWFLTWWSSLSTILALSGEQSNCTFSGHTLLCVFTSFKPSINKQPVLFTQYQCTMTGITVIRVIGLGSLYEIMGPQFHGTSIL